MAYDKVVDSAVLDGYFSDIADAIRSKDGTQNTYTPAQMPQAIEDIPSGGGDDLFDKLLENSIEGDIKSNAHSVYKSRFFGAIGITSIKLPQCSHLFQNALYQCSNLEMADIGLDLSVATLITFDMYAFYQSTNFKALVIRPGSTVATLNNTNALQNTRIGNGGGYIYVPDALKSTYQAATNWSTYSAQFRSLEDYTDDGTITGEFIMPQN